MKYSLLFLLICLLASCSSPDKLLCRTWKVDEITFGKKAEPGGLGANIQDQVREQLKRDFKFTFSSDSNYIVQKKDEQYKGKWWWTSKDKTQVATSSEMQKGNAKIIELKAKRLVFEMNDVSGSPMKFECSPIANKK